LITQNQFNIHSKTTTSGNLINVKFKQLMPAEPDLQRDFRRRHSFTFVALQIPAEARNLSVTSPQAVHVPFTKPYYQKLFEKRKDRTFTLLPDIDYMISTSRNLYSPDGNPPGFVYHHLNGSKVLGIYIHDSGSIAEVEFSFELPEGGDVIKFYGQPGLREPSLGLGEGVNFYNYPKNLRSLENYYQIPAGVYLEI
jgi:hypothetical protein